MAKPSASPQRGEARLRHAPILPVAERHGQDRFCGQVAARPAVQAGQAEGQAAVQAAQHRADAQRSWSGVWGLAPKVLGWICH